MEKKRERGLAVEGIIFSLFVAPYKKGPDDFRDLIPDNRTPRRELGSGRTSVLEELEEGYVQFNMYASPSESDSESDGAGHRTDQELYKSACARSQARNAPHSCPGAQSSVD